MRLIDGDGLRNEVHKTVLEVADTPIPHDYASKLAIEMGKLFLKKIDEAPTVDAEPVRHGRWIDMQEDDATEGMWRCSVCGFDGYFDIMTPKECGTNYCPNCGAKMDAEVEG